MKSTGFVAAELRTSLLLVQAADALVCLFVAAYLAGWVPRWLMGPWWMWLLLALFGACGFVGTWRAHPRSSAYSGK